MANLPVALFEIFFIGTDIMSNASKSSIIKARIALSEKTQKKRSFCMAVHHADFKGVSEACSKRPEKVRIVTFLNRTRLLLQPFI